MTAKTSAAKALALTSRATPATIGRHIYIVRAQKVMLDSDLAELYGVTTKVFNQAVKRNLNRFPPDFMFQVTKEEAEDLRSQSVTSKTGAGGRRYLPYVFTEQGVAMLSSVLGSKEAVMVNISIMRAFVQMREMVLSNRELAQKLTTMESKYDAQFKVVFQAIKSLISPPMNPKRVIGFRGESGSKKKTSVKK